MSPHFVRKQLFTLDQKSVFISQGRCRLLKSGVAIDVVVVFWCVPKVQIGWEKAGEKYERLIVSLVGVGASSKKKNLIQDVCRSDSKAF